MQNQNRNLLHHKYILYINTGMLCVGEAKTKTKIQKGYPNRMLRIIQLLESTIQC